MHIDPHLWPQLAFGLILLSGLYLFISEKLRVDVTAMLILLALVLTRLLDDKQALSGFSSEPAIIVAAVFVISGALGATGISERLGSWMERASGNHEWRTIAVEMPLVALLASYTHHVMVTAMKLPLLPPRPLLQLLLQQTKHLQALQQLLPLRLLQRPTLQKPQLQRLRLRRRLRPDYIPR